MRCGGGGGGGGDVVMMYDADVSGGAGFQVEVRL